MILWEDGEKISYFLKFVLQNVENWSWNRKKCQLLTYHLEFFFHFASHRLWRGSMSLEVFMILFDVSFLFDSDVELTSILSYSMHILTQSRCSLLFVSAADSDLCHTKGPRLLRMAQYLGYCEVWQEWSSHDCSYCPHLRKLMADVHVKMISGCTNDRWLYAVDKDLGVHAPQQSDLLLIDNT